jgi:hypothetical protein
MSVTLTFDPGGANELTLDESQIIRLNPAWTHTGKADLRAEVEITRSLDDYAQRQDRLNVSIDSTVEWTGFVTGTPHNERRGTTTLRAEGIEKKLEETRPDYDSIGGPVTYSNIALHDALRDYWGRTPFSSYNVTDQTTTLIEDNTQIQSADTTTEWQAIDSLISSTDPALARNGNIELLQTCFTQEGENWDVGSDSGSGGLDSSYSGGVAATFDGASGDVTYQFNVDHTIPEDEVAVYTRNETSPGNDGPNVNLYLNGTKIDELPSGAGIADPTWRNHIDDGFDSGLDGWANGDLTPADNPHEFRIDAAGGGTDLFVVDVVAPLDEITRITGGSDATAAYFFDNDNGGSDGYLDGPELYPDELPVELDERETSFNITQGNISSAWDDTSNNQAIAVSNDGGDNYTSANNTTSLTANFSSAGRTAQTKLTFSRYGSRTTATPQTGFNGQKIQDYTLTVDLNDLVVIDSIELTRNHWDNLQTLHNYGDFNWVIEHSSNDISNIVVESFQEGQVTRTAPSEWDNPNNRQPEVNAENYFNSVYLEGALSGGTRPTAEVKDSTAISNDNREIQAFLRDLTITTDAGATFRANSLLETATSENDLEGRIVALPNFVHPGYAYSVDFGEGANDKTLETVNWSYTNNENRMTFEFTVDEGFAEDVNRLKRQARDLENQV